MMQSKIRGGLLANLEQSSRERPTEKRQIAELLDNNKVETQKGQPNRQSDSKRLPDQLHGFRSWVWLARSTNLSTARSYNNSKAKTLNALQIALLYDSGSVRLKKIFDVKNLHLKSFTEENFKHKFSFYLKKKKSKQLILIIEYFLL